MTVPLSLTHVLSHYLTPQQQRRYFKSESWKQVFPARHHYNSALRDLSIRDSESALFHMIMVLEIEPAHTATLHLARTMLVGLNQLFHEAGGELYRMKYPNLTVWREKLETQLQEKEYEAQRLRNEISLSQPKGILGRLIDRWWGHWRRQKIEQWQARLDQLPTEIKELQKQRSHAIKMGQIQEYAKLISLILEICLFPARYTWVNENKNPASYQEQVWYG